MKLRKLQYLGDLIKRVHFKKLQKESRRENCWERGVEDGYLELTI